jgi:hypothetical protein
MMITTHRGPQMQCVGTGLWQGGDTNAASETPRPHSGTEGGQDFQLDGALSITLTLFGRFSTKMPAKALAKAQNLNFKGGHHENSISVNRSSSGARWLNSPRVEQSARGDRDATRIVFLPAFWPICVLSAAT